MHVTNKQFSDKFNNDYKSNQNGQFIEIFVFYVNNFTLWARCGRNNNFKFNKHDNGGRLLSSVLYFMIHSSTCL